MLSRGWRERGEEEAEVPSMQQFRTKDQNTSISISGIFHAINLWMYDK